MMMLNHTLKALNPADTFKHISLNMNFYNTTPIADYLSAILDGHIAM